MSSFQTGFKIFRFIKPKPLQRQQIRQASNGKNKAECEKKKSCKEQPRGPCGPRDIPIPRLDCKVRKVVVPSCIAGNLPCCPPVRIPPDCNVPQPPPVCEKKPPPMPSMSELMKTLPLKPFTECDCWLPKPIICNKKPVGKCKASE